MRQMPRLAGLCLSPEGVATLDLVFEQTAGEGLRIMHGQVRATPRLRCERCLEPMEFALAAEPYLVLVRAGEREDLIEAGDARVIEKPLPLSELVEDELLLALPMVPVHVADRCTVKTGGIADTNKTEPERRNPFAALEKLKRPDR